MSWHPALNQLRDALAELYPDVADARRVVASAILPIDRIDWQGKAVNVWQSILEEAVKQDCVEAVSQVATTEYPANTALREAVEACRQWAALARRHSPEKHEPAKGSPEAKRRGRPLRWNSSEIRATIIIVIVLCAVLPLLAQRRAPNWMASLLPARATPTPRLTPHLDLVVELTSEVRVGSEVVIRADLEPQGTSEIMWSIEGTAGGKLNAGTGGYFIYTPDQAGTAFITFSVTTESGMRVEHRIELQVLPASSSAPTATAGPTIVTSVPPTSRVIVDLSEQTMAVYQDDQPIHTFTICTGRASAPTIPGRYTVLDKFPMAYSSAWGLDMPWWVGIYWAEDSEVGFHGLPTRHGTGEVLWTNNLGRHCSFGAIVLDVEDAKVFYDSVEIGTAVFVNP